VVGPQYNKPFGTLGAAYEPHEVVSGFILCASGCSLWMSCIVDGQHRATSDNNDLFKMENTYRGLLTALTLTQSLMKMIGRMTTMMMTKTSSKRDKDNLICYAKSGYNSKPIYTIYGTLALPLFRKLVTMHLFAQINRVIGTRL
jgi:hypothetical protein